MAHHDAAQHTIFHRFSSQVAVTCTPPMDIRPVLVCFKTGCVARRYGPGLPECLFGYTQSLGCFWLGVWSVLKAV